MYIESSGRTKGDNAILYSPKYRGLQPQCIKFFYHMTGRHTGKLTVYTRVKHVLKLSADFSYRLIGSSPQKGNVVRSS